MSKYHNEKVLYDGIMFDSRKEARRWIQLKEQVQKGRISELRRQVQYELIPTQREPDSVGARGGVHKGKVLERSCNYVADFVYMTADGELVVEDTKSVATRTPEYKIKKKLMLWVHGLHIREV